MTLIAPLPSNPNGLKSGLSSPGAFVQVKSVVAQAGWTQLPFVKQAYDTPFVNYDTPLTEKQTSAKTKPTTSPPPKKKTSQITVRNTDRNSLMQWYPVPITSSHAKSKTCCSTTFQKQFKPDQNKTFLPSKVLECRVTHSYSWVNSEKIPVFFPVYSRHVHVCV